MIFLPFSIINVLSNCLRSFFYTKIQLNAGLSEVPHKVITVVEERYLHKYDNIQS